MTENLYGRINNAPTSYGRVNGAFTAICELGIALDVYQKGYYFWLREYAILEEHFTLAIIEIERLQKLIKKLEEGQTP